MCPWVRSQNGREGSERTHTGPGPHPRRWPSAAGPGELLWPLGISAAGSRLQLVSSYSPGTAWPMAASRLTDWERSVWQLLLETRYPAPRQLFSSQLVGVSVLPCRSMVFRPGCMASLGPTGCLAESLERGVWARAVEGAHEPWQPVV